MIARIIRWSLQQRLLVLRRQDDGRVVQQDIAAVSFVPLLSGYID